MTTPALWQPTAEQAGNSNLARLMAKAAGEAGRADRQLYGLPRLDRPQSRKPSGTLVWDDCGIIGARGDRVLADGDRMPGARFFPDAELNFAENLLATGLGEGDAIVFRGEDKAETPPDRGISCAPWCHAAAAAFPLARNRRGRPHRGDDAEHAGNRDAAMLAAASIGAVWSSCSPDFGPKGRARPFSQIEPVPSSPATATGTTASGSTIADKLAEDHAGAADRAQHADRRLSGRCRGCHCGSAGCPDGHLRAGGLHADSEPPVRVPSGCRSIASALYPVLVRNDRGSRNASSIPPAARCCSTARSIAITPASCRATGCSTSQPAAG